MLVHVHLYFSSYVRTMCCSLWGLSQSTLYVGDVHFVHTKKITRIESLMHELVYKGTYIDMYMFYIYMYSLVLSHTFSYSLDRNRQPMNVYTIISIMDTIETCLTSDHLVFQIETTYIHFIYFIMSIIYL